MSTSLPPEVEAIHDQRKRAKAYPGGLYYFTKAILNQNKLKKHLHLPFCNSLQLHPWNGGPKYSHRTVHWMPREHFKSTCASKAFPLWLLACVDRNMTIALVSANEKNTSKWLRFIKDQVEFNGVFRALFPEIRPGDKWDQNEIIITRDRGADAQTQASITALSIGSGLASQHFDYLICDDLVNEQTVAAADSTIQMEKAINLYHALEDILQGWEDSKGFRVVGTPWGREDVIWEALKEEKMGKRMKWGIGALGKFEVSKSYGEFLPDVTPDVTEGEPILPTECNWDKLNFLKGRNREQFQLQYLCDPYIDGHNGFDLNKIAKAAYLPDGTLQCACPEHRLHKHHIRFASTVAVSDPAYTKDKRGCESATLVGSLLPCGCRFLLEERGEHLMPLEYVEMACKLANKWKTWLKAYCPEDEALQLTLRQWLEERQSLGQFPISVSIHGVKAKNRAKDSRIENAQPAVNAGFWHIMPQMEKVTGDKPNTMGQLFQWPFSRKRDRADAFAYFEDAWMEFPVERDFMALMEGGDPDDQADGFHDDWNDDRAFIAQIQQELYR